MNAPDKFGTLWPEMPHTVMIEPTNGCNLRCRMCFNNAMTREKGFMSEAVYSKTMERCHVWLLR